MRPSNRWGELRAEPADRGSASLEFITVGVLMLVPLIYVIVALGQIQGQAMGAEAAARHIARAIVSASDAAGAAERADAVLASVIEEYGMAANEVEISIRCTTAGPCPQPGATVIVGISTRVALPLVPGVLDLDRLASVPIEATAMQKVSRLWGRS